MDSISKRISAEQERVVSDFVSREKLENQLEIMVSQRGGLLTSSEQAAARVSANDGAIQMIQYLLTQCNDGAVEVAALVDEKDNTDDES